MPGLRQGSSRLLSVPKGATFFPPELVSHFLDQSYAPVANSCLLYTSPSPRD